MALENREYSFSSSENFESLGMILYNHRASLINWYMSHTVLDLYFSATSTALGISTSPQLSIHKQDLMFTPKRHGQLPIQTRETRRRHNRQARKDAKVPRALYQDSTRYQMQNRRLERHEHPKMGGVLGGT